MPNVPSADMKMAAVKRTMFSKMPFVGILQAMVQQKQLFDQKRY